MSELVDDRAVARALAERALHENAVDVGPIRLLPAGAHQYKTVWARDFSMAVKGALVAGEAKAVHDTLEALLSRQREDGLLPRMIDQLTINQRFLGSMIWHKDRPLTEPLNGYFETENRSIAIDGNATVPWAASEYIAATGDVAFAERWYDAAARSLAWLDGCADDGVVGHQPPFSDWADSLRREGKVAFTNEMWLLALDGMVDWSTRIGRDPAPWQAKRDAARARFVDVFFDAERGLVRESVPESGARIAADANLIAVAHDLLPREDALRVVDAMEATPLWTPMPGRAAWPDYPRSMKSRNVKLAGLADYHDELYWTWISAMAALAEGALGRCAERDAILGQLAAEVAREADVYEVLELHDGSLRPVHRPLYRAEHPFTWGAGLYLEADATPCRG